MSSRFSNKKPKTPLKPGKVTVNNSLKDYSQEEFVVRKVDMANDMLAKSIFPKLLLKTK
jgi:hypothetical protein